MWVKVPNISELQFTYLYGDNSYLLTHKAVGRSLERQYMWNTKPTVYTQEELEKCQLLLPSQPKDKAPGGQGMMSLFSAYIEGLDT